MELILFILVSLSLGGLIVITGFFLLLFTGSIRHSKTQGVTPDLGTMDEGDYHSGPYGYSPNTAYPETQYGSMFDLDADWNDWDGR